MELTKKTTRKIVNLVIIYEETLQKDLPKLERKHKGTHGKSPLQLII